MRILGIETSCDETAAAVVEDGHRLLSNVVVSSLNLQAKYGGVVPEIAARSHLEAMMPVVQQALEEASDIGHRAQGKGQRRTAGREPLWDQIDAIAVTYGAGLGGCLLVGVMTARTLAIIKNKPLYGINHVAAHMYANFITEVAGGRKQQADYKLPAKQPVFPLLALIVSGGHSQLVLFRDHFDYTLLGQTHDDAIGEAFDKAAKVLGLPYPGGPSIEKAARGGDPFKYLLPKAKLPGKYDFSFSGPKTAFLRAVQAACGKNHQFPSFKLAELLSEPQKADFAASFQRVAVETVVDKTLLAYEEFQPASVVIAGGVAASAELRRQLQERLPIPIAYTDPKLCTDNGAMVATLACFTMAHGHPTADPYSLEIAPNLSM
jgi:N6-L-threonylcarbamoyladenine synthase